MIIWFDNDGNRRVCLIYYRIIEILLGVEDFFIFLEKCDIF